MMEGEQNACTTPPASPTNALASLSRLSLEGNSTIAPEHGSAEFVPNPEATTAARILDAMLPQMDVGSRSPSENSVVHAPTHENLQEESVDDNLFDPPRCARKPQIVGQEDVIPPLELSLQPQESFDTACETLSITSNTSYISIYADLEAMDVIEKHAEFTTPSPRNLESGFDEAIIEDPEAVSRLLEIAQEQLQQLAPPLVTQITRVTKVDASTQTSEEKSQRDAEREVDSARLRLILSSASTRVKSICNVRQKTLQFSGHIDKKFAEDLYEDLKVNWERLQRLNEDLSTFAFRVPGLEYFGFFKNNEMGAAESCFNEARDYLQQIIHKTIVAVNVVESAAQTNAQHKPGIPLPPSDEPTEKRKPEWWQLTEDDQVEPPPKATKTNAARSPRESRGNTSQERNPQPSTSRGFTTPKGDKPQGLRATPEGKPTATRRSCIYCRESHALFRCPSFRNRTRREMYQYLVEHDLCINCMGFHTNCNSKNSCHFCGGGHHSLICPEEHKKEANNK